MARRWLWGLGALGAAAIVPVAVVGTAFLGVAPLPDTLDLGEGVALVKDSFVAVYLIRAGDGVVLVDAGVDPQAAAVREALARWGMTTDDVRAVLLTHGHGDHVAGVAALPGVEVVALAEEAPLLDGTAPERSPVARLLGHDDSGVRATRPVRDGEVLRWDDVTVQVHALPGHTAGSAAFLARGVLFVGDSAGSNAAVALTPAPWFFTDDTAENRRALTRLVEGLADPAPRWIAPAHAAPVPGDKAIASWRQEIGEAGPPGGAGTR